MTIYRFSVEVSGIDPNETGLEDRFYGNGVDDALISVSNGRLFLAFDREALDAESAIHSATEDIVKRGGSVAQVVWDSPRTWDSAN
jgi:hypothetical protein